jgi:hypothetical protein
MLSGFFTAVFGVANLFSEKLLGTPENFSSFSEAELSFLSNLKNQKYL